MDHALYLCSQNNRDVAVSYKSASNPSVKNLKYHRQEKTAKHIGNSEFVSNNLVQSPLSGSEQRASPITLLSGSLHYLFKEAFIGLCIRCHNPKTSDL